MTVSKTTKTVLIALAAAFAGGILIAAVGAFSIWFPLHSSNKSSFLGPDKSWAIIGAFMGAFYGFPAGALVGLLIAFKKPTYILGVLIGGGVGLLMALFLGALGEPDFALAAWLSVPGCAVTGLFCTWIANAMSNSLQVWPQSDKSTLGLSQ